MDLDQEQDGIEEHPPQARAHAIREVIANAIDEQILTKTKDIEIFRDSKSKWHIRDYGPARNHSQQIFKLFPSKLRPKYRKRVQAYEGLNNIFNLAYEMLSWKVHRAPIKAKLEPFLGFLHATKFERAPL